MSGTPNGGDEGEQRALRRGHVEVSSRPASHLRTSGSLWRLKRQHGGTSCRNGSYPGCWRRDQVPQSRRARHRPLFLRETAERDELRPASLVIHRPFGSALAQRRRRVMAGIEVKARTALVTGSSRGIGRGIALKLADCGVRRIGVHFQKNRELAEQTARLLRERRRAGADPSRRDKPRGHLPDVRGSADGIRLARFSRRQCPT